MEDASPTFAKALLRYNPEDAQQANENRRRRLKVLSDHAHSAGYKFMLELLVPATVDQLDSVVQVQHAYGQNLLPQLTVNAIRELQSAGIEPDVWKLEGAEEAEAIRSVVIRARTGGRDKVGIIVLGRGRG